MIYFVNPVVNNNVGDVAIFYASSKLFQSQQIEYTTVNKDNYSHIHPSKTDIIALCGGGWMGIYDDSLIDFFLYMIQKYSTTNKVILLPCSFVPLRTNFVRVAHCKCQIYARDMVSYHYFKKYWVNANVIFCHDMAFSLPKINHRNTLSHLTKYNIGIYDRNDAESVGEIKRYESYGMHESRFGQFVPCSNDIHPAASYIAKQLSQMSQYSMVVTDTLHMSIFSYLLNIPCLYMDNNYHKLSNTWSYYPASIVHPINDSYGLDITKYQLTDNISYQFDYSELIQNLIV